MSYTFKTHLLFSAHGCAEHEPALVIKYSVSPGSEPTREDPGCPAEVSIESIKVETRNGWEEAQDWLFDALENDDDLTEALLVDAGDQDEYFRDQAADARREEQMLERNR